MSEFIINEETVALRKDENKTIIYNVDNCLVINKNLKNILNTNCLYYGSDLNGRRRSAQRLLNMKYKVPIIISDINNYILISIGSLRDNNCLLIMLNKIIEKDNYLKIICAFNQEFVVNISKYSFEKLLINAIKLNNLLKWRKNVNNV